MFTTKTLLDTTQYGVPTGNYDGSSLDWASNPCEAANYYRGRSGLQTLLFNLAGFVGTIVIEATLDSLAESAIWFDVYTIDSASLPLTDYRSVTIPGNFVWVRARVEGFDAGTIESITISY